jgi:Frataxin-like domain
MLQPLRPALLSPLLQRTIYRRRLTLPIPLRFYSASLEVSEYHRLADDTMDKLTSELETLLEENDLTGSDVEYSVLFF